MAYTSRKERVLIVGNEASIDRVEGVSGHTADVELVGSLVEAASKQASGGYTRVIIDPLAFDGSAYEVLADTRNLKRASDEPDFYSECLEAVSENTKTHLAYLDRDFNFLWVNSAYAAGCAHSKEDLVGHNHFELFPHEENEAIFRQVRDTGVPFSVREKPFTFPDHPEWGTTYWDWSLTPMKDQAGLVRRMVFSLVDVTERKRAEEALRASEELFRTIFESAAIGIATVDLVEKRLTGTNEALQEMLGYSAQELLGLTLGQITHPDDIEQDLQLFQESLEGKTSHFHMEKRYLRKDGEIVWGYLSGSVVRGHDGEPIYAIGLIEDITWRKQAEKSLAEARDDAERRAAQLQSFISSMADGVTLFDADGQILAMNDTGRSMFAVPAGEQKMGWEGYQRFSLDGEEFGAEDTASYRALRGETVRDMQYRLTTPWGKELIVSVSAAPVRDSEGGIIGATSVFRDVGDRVKFEKERDELLDRERHIASVLQQAIIPPDVPGEIGGYSLAVRYVPALREAEVGGDFYDVFELDEGKYAVLIGDVAGKGLPAAIRVAEARHAIRSYAFLDPSPGRVMTLANDALCRDRRDEAATLTAFLAILDPRTGMITYTSAGHEPPVVCGLTGSCGELDLGGTPLGLIENAIYPQSSLSLTAGDVLVMVTDGITEARSEDHILFDKWRMIDHIRRNCACVPGDMAAGLLDAATAHAGGRLQDDAAIVVLKAT